VAKLIRLEAVLILVPAVEEGVVQVALYKLLIVTNAVATMGAVSIPVRKPTRDVPAHAFQDIDAVEVHVLVCEY